MTAWAIALAGEAERDARKAARDEVGDLVALGEDEGEGAWPEFLHEGQRHRGEILSHRLDLVEIGYVDNKGIEVGPRLGLEDPRYGRLVEGVGSEAVDGLGRYDDELTDG